MNYECQQIGPLKMEEEIKTLREQTAKVRSETAELRRGVEQLKRELRTTTIPELLCLYHIILPPVKVETTIPVTTTGNANPAHRKSPKRIVPWDNFASRQQDIWDIICASSTYSDRLFESAHVIKRKPLRSDKKLAANEGFAVREPVEAVLREFIEDKALRKLLRLPDCFKVYFDCFLKVRWSSKTRYLGREVCQYSQKHAGIHSERAYQARDA